MNNAWLYIKRITGRIIRRHCLYLLDKVINFLLDVQMVHRILLFCWKWPVVRFLTRNYPHFKKGRTRIRWENMYHYKVELETARDLQEDNTGFLNMQSIQIGNHGHVIVFKRNPDPIPEGIFSRN